MEEAGEVEWWYVGNDGEKIQAGPIDILEALWLAGEMDGQTLVWKEGMSECLPVAQVDELRTHFQALDGQDEDEDEDEDEAQALPEGEAVAAGADAGTAHAAGGDVKGGGIAVAGCGVGSTLTGRQVWELQWASAQTEMEGGGTGVYYANKYTYESSWTPPVEPLFDDDEAALVSSPWMLCWTAGGAKFWLNLETHVRQEACPFHRGPAFIAAETFGGLKKGYLFKKGPQGVGYYADPKALEQANLDEERRLAQAAAATQPVAAEEQVAESGVELEGRTDRENGQLTAAGKRKRKRVNKKAKWKKPKDNTYVYVQGLPEDTSVEEVAKFFGKFGVLRPDEADGKPKIKLYTDTEGNLKGDARVGFLKNASVPLVLELADGMFFREDSQSFALKVSAAEFQQKGDKFVAREKPSEEARKKHAATAAALRQKERALDWGADDGIDDGRGLRIVIIKNLFAPAELATPEDVLQLQFEIDVEAKKLGEVEKVTIFEGNPDGVVAVKFKLPSAAEACIGVMNGRFFGGRQLTCDFWDNTTNYVVKKQESSKKEEARLESFGAWLEDQDSDDELDALTTDSAKAKAAANAHGRGNGGQDKRIEPGDVTPPPNMDKVRQADADDTHDRVYRYTPQCMHACYLQDLHTKIQTLRCMYRCDMRMRTACRMRSPRGAPPPAPPTRMKTSMLASVRDMCCRCCSVRAVCAPRPFS